MENRNLQPNGTERYDKQQGKTQVEIQEGGSQQDLAKATRLNATVQDITERHLLERAKSDLISTVSHE